ncbi:MAG TPA: recombinase family protein, partial [Anaerolineales bacterium]|nr:recombinase family protein [Anaerolineales bacterium]
MNNNHLETGSAYIRYSSTMQDDSFSLDAQLRQIKIRAASDGVEIVKVYSDPATSAYSKKNRPGLEEMLADAKRGLFKFAYVHKLDRLSRRLEWALEIVKILQNAGVTLRSVEQKFDLDTPDGKLLFAMLGSLGEFFSDNLSQETGKGKLERATQGYHNNQVPWGYKSELVGVKKQAVPDPNTQEIVKQMFERYSTGLYYDQEIADWLTDLGHITSRGRPFTKDTVREMLLNKFYLGLTNYNGRHGHKGKRHEKDRVWIKGVHSPLISKELFEKCLKVRASRRRMMNSKQKTFRVYFLAGIITC